MIAAALEGGEWSAACPSRTLPRERSATHFTGGGGPQGCSRPHRDSIPDRPARGQSLYWLSYRAYEVSKLQTKICFFFSNTCQLATLAICELCIFTNYNVAELTVVDGKRGSGWLTGSRPRRILLALWLSFSQAWARICSACTEVRCAGVGRVWANKNIIWTCQYLKKCWCMASQQYDNIPATVSSMATYPTPRKTRKH